MIFYKSLKWREWFSCVSGPCGIRCLRFSVRHILERTNKSEWYGGSMQEEWAIWEIHPLGRYLRICGEIKCKDIWKWCRVMVRNGTSLVKWQWEEANVCQHDNNSVTWGENVLNKNHLVCALNEFLIRYLKESFVYLCCSVILYSVKW